jgi:cytochrome c oxidase subunit 1
MTTSELHDGQEPIANRATTQQEPTLLGKLFPSHLTGVIGAIIGYLVFAAITRAVTPADDLMQPDKVYLWGFIGLTLGWLIGVGALNYPARWLVGLPDPPHEEPYRGPGYYRQIWRYFRWNVDHKIIGIQYLVLTLVMLALGGTGAMLIRLDLLVPGSRFFPPNTYETIVTMHGMLMIATMFSIIVGPFGNYFVPIMIGARDMAFPRLNALSWHLLLAGVVVFLFIPFIGGLQTGWTFYSPLADQTEPGADVFAVGVFLMLVSSSIGLINMLTTIITMRAPGMTWTRLPLFLWGIIGTAFLTAASSPSWFSGFIQVLLDRAYQTTFFLNIVPGSDTFVSTANTGGGNAYLYEVTFWFFAHPEVYILAIPGWAALMEVTTVFSRKPAFTYKLAILGIVGVTLNSFLVWGHHLFVSGWAPALRGYYMFTTEMISIPTGFIFITILGTLWKGRLWMKLPLAWVFAFLWTFTIGGITGIYLSDVPLDIQIHGTYFVAGHFHYVILGSMLWGFFALCFYWFPKITGRYLDERLGWIHFWGTNITFNLVFATFFLMGWQGLPRRVADYAPLFNFANTWASIFAFLLGASMIVFFADIIWSWRYGERADANPWGAKTLEWQVPSPVPPVNFAELPVVSTGPYDYGEKPQPSAPARVEPAPSPSPGT